LTLGCHPRKIGWQPTCEMQDVSPTCELSYPT